jgi:hypothetical protein
MRQPTPPINAHNFPKLAEFARGYLHQDLVAEYGSSSQAARAYLEDLTAAERMELSSEVMRLRNALRYSPTIKDPLRNLGAACDVSGEEELSRLLHTLETGI